MKKLVLMGIGLLLVAGCQKAKEIEKPEIARKVIAPRMAAPRPVEANLSYRERKARGLLTPEEQREEEGLDRIERQIAAGDIEYTAPVVPRQRRPDPEAKWEDIRERLREAGEQRERKKQEEAIRADLAAQQAARAARERAVYSIHRGMSAAEVLASCGYPDDVQEVDNRRGHSEIWYYGGLLTSYHIQVVFDTRGKVTAVHKY